MAEQIADYACPTCGHIDPPDVPGWHLCSLMRRVPDDERIEFSPEVRAELEAKLDEFDRCRARAAVDARSAWIG